ncbi:uncharacterized protein IL334_007762 [Kwoniella shivajii]|uniref:Uncharacterized protein n=1 Tax=Kwoniella shivajii TaxID=564305 RepID=A0ABZ1D9K2_9TREE|nr:hypothetical protein IL334_007762 [Kwoniella shivajii]
MTSLARPINFPTSRPSYDRLSSSSPSPSSSPKSSSLELTSSSPSQQQHPCPHLNQFVQSLVKAYWGPNTPSTNNSTMMGRSGRF